MIGGVQKKLLLQINDGKLELDEAFAELTGLSKTANWKLVRERDNLTVISSEVAWAEWHDDGTRKATHKLIKEGRSLIMQPFNQSLGWQTTLVTEITETNDTHIKFKTSNSNYTLYKLKEY